MASPHEQHAAPPRGVHSVLLGVLAFLGYAATASDAVQGGDAGEFVVLGALGGVAHPPGYPLYVLMCRAFAAVPVGTVAWRVAVGTALLAGAAVAVLHDALVRSTGHRAASLLVTLVMATSSTWWRYANVAEVFALHGLVVCGVLNVAARVHGGWRGRAPLLAMGGVLAVGVAHHHTVILLAPLAAWTAWHAAETGASLRVRLRLLLMVGGVSAAGLLPYLLLMDRSGGWAWGNTDTWEGLLHHVLRRDYGTLRLSSRDEGVPPWANPLVFLRMQPRAWLYVFLPALLAVPAAVMQSRTRTWVMAVAASWFLSGPAFLSLSNVPPVQVGLAVVERFHVMPTLLLAPLVALGTAHLAQRARLTAPATVLITLATLLAGVVHGADAAGRAQVTWLEDHVENALASVEEGALIVGHGDDRQFAFLHAQEVLGRRKDVLYVDPGLLRFDWYQRRLQQHGVTLTADAWAPAAGKLAARRPVYLAHHYWLHERHLLAGLPPIYPENPSLLRVSPDGRRPSLNDVEPRLASAAVRLVLRSAPASLAELDERWEGEAFRQYAQSFEVLRELQAAANDPVAAERARMMRDFWLQPWTWETAALR